MISQKSYARCIAVWSVAAALYLVIDLIEASRTQVNVLVVAGFSALALISGAGAVISAAYWLRGRRRRAS